MIPTFIHGKHVLGHLGWAVGRRFLFLLLRLLPSENILSKDKLYEVGLPVKIVVSSGLWAVTSVHFPHVVYAPTDVNDGMLQRTTSATWRKLYLADEHVITTLKTTDTSVFDSMVPFPEPVSSHAPFNLDLCDEGGEFGNLKKNVTPRRAHVPWTGDPPLTLRLKSSPFQLRLGVCTRPDLPVASPKRVAHWAYIVHAGPFNVTDNSLEAGHDCSKDHISTWPGFSRQYGYQESYGGCRNTGLLYHLHHSNGIQNALWCYTFTHRGCTHLPMIARLYFTSE